MTKKVRPIKVEGSIGMVPLTKGYTALIDASDADMIGMYNWCVYERKSTCYAVRSENGKTVLMHRQIMKFPEGLEIDHKLGNGLDNRKCNLRTATHSQNMHNRRLNKNNKSGYKGVFFDKSRNAFVASICLDNKQRTIGSYETAEQAHEAYCKESANLHKSFGRT